MGGQVFLASLCALTALPSPGLRRVLPSAKRVESHWLRVDGFRRSVFWIFVPPSAFSPQPSAFPGSGGHQREGGAPGSVLRGAANGADAHAIDRARGEVRDDNAPGVPPDARIHPRLPAIRRKGSVTTIDTHAAAVIGCRSCRANCESSTPAPSTMS